MPGPCTLDSGINLSPGMTVVALLKIFIHITILIFFFWNLGIVVIFRGFFLQNFSKINKPSPIYIKKKRRGQALLFSFQ